MTTQEVLGEYLGFLPLALVGASIRAAATLPHGVVDGNSFASLRWEVSSSEESEEEDGSPRRASPD
jgi:hypothetical protein